MGDDVFFFLRHTFLVFFDGVGGAGIGSSGVELTISKSSYTMLVMKSGTFLSSSASSIEGS